MRTARDLSGQRFGRLTVLRRGENAGQNVRWFCRCECGNERLVFAGAMQSGHTTSCGCRSREVVIARSTKHGHATNGITPTYHSWSGMVARCTRPEHKSFADYGGAGITVCERWMTFANFLADMGEKPRGTSIDRIDNARGYEPGNCQWATDQRQARNKSNNRMLTLNGETLPLPEWADRLGMRAHTIRDRIAEGWSDERALTEPVGKNRRVRGYRYAGR